ncbi:uncharacterized protein LOC109726866 [Ananas comosus]|uniref:Uncharacterized protein LOC109726866 n=1 Tax=Ananas comosus TaxID=4615 RepID=A0A6P5GWW2_ANACO|nr:uncharacterized protein LOC109726866 [Ananas comosus]
MADDYGSTERWTLRSLLGAFLDLAIAYIFLCAAAVAFAASKFFSFFGVSLSASSSFSCQHCPPPFALRPTPADCNRCPPAPSGRSSRATSSRRALILYNNNNNNNNNNNTVKGAAGGEEKPVVVLRHRRRRHRRASLASSSRDDLSESDSAPPAPLPPLRLGWKREETPIPIAYPEQYDNSVGDEQEIGDRRARCFGLENDAFNQEHCDLTIEELRRAIEEERAARAALSRELEKERSAAASAADEAMAMMQRLHKEKAAVEIEARQYRRMVEEKSAYDGEEMATLKEILVRREREKYVLEMELEEYQQMMMNNTGSGGGGGGGGRCEQSQDSSPLTRKPSASVDSLDRDAILHGTYESVEKSSGMDTEMLSSRSPPEDYSQECCCCDISLHSINQDGGATDKEVAGSDGHVYDVHVIDDDKMSLDDDQNVKHLKPSHTESGSSEASTVEQSSATSVIRPTEMEDLRGSSLSFIDTEKLALEKEVALLRKRLEAIQQGREKLRFPLDRTEEETLRLQILKEISYQLEEINKSTEAGEATLHISKIS